MSINQPLLKNINKNKLYLSLTNEKITFIKNLIFGGFSAYNNFVKKYRADLFLDTRYQDEICNSIDSILLNIIKNNIPYFGLRELREHQIIKALQNDDMTDLASILASIGRSSVAFTVKISHYIALYYKTNNNNFFEDSLDEEINKLVKISKTKNQKQYQLILDF
ncbi:hypothetical protein [Arcobacter cloacae]|uniref:Uncharacterized protein n=1 Tax=Arcobacter cloacae TaxID=1054034 RepID=A0A6M8NKG6_9BACT|nr:hypothetical protein [Arcobacter cloacae]QKF89690.1 hypothetical protein ACLO_1188 [Arcobacter cloacae]RXI40686.1 hypothetical protein CP963_07880 [Arcobacter cloacae]